MEIIKPPNSIRLIRDEPAIFLAGSIEQGKAEDWQTEVEGHLQCYFPNKGVILNPRRDDWDASWEQEITNPEFKEQVSWELEALERCDVVGMYFDPNTKSPITLLEFGLYARSGKLIVCCPKGFWRRGNIDIVCQRYNVWQIDVIRDFDAGLEPFAAALVNMYRHPLNK